MIYADSLSKTVGGGLRIGWLAARGPVHERLALLKLETDLPSSATLEQHIAARYLAAGGYDELLERARTVRYRERRDVAAASCARAPHGRASTRSSPPQGGHHAWITLTRNLDDRALYDAAVRHGVAFTPGVVVTAERSTQTRLRLSFSLLSPEQLDQGVKRLARAVRELARASTRPRRRAISLS